MLGNVYINKIHARQYLYKITLYCRGGGGGGGFHPFNFLLHPKESFMPKRLISKQLGRKDFSIAQLPKELYFN